MRAAELRGRPHASPNCAASSPTGATTATGSRSCPPWARCTRATWRWCAAPASAPTRTSCRSSSTRASSPRTRIFARYPRDEAGDLAKLGGAAAISCGRRRAAEMYPEGFATRIVPAGAARARERFPPALLRRRRDGVLPSCSAPRRPMSPCSARRTISSLRHPADGARPRLPLEIIGVPTMREADGLALSSRNAYLTAEERTVAPALNRVLRDVAGKASAVMRGAGPAKTRPPRPTPLVRDPTLPPQAHQLPDLDGDLRGGRGELLAAGFTKVDYVAVRDAETLESRDGNRRGAVARAGRRLARRHAPHRQRRLRSRPGAGACASRMPRGDQARCRRT